MDFYHRDTAPDNGVPQCNRSVGVTSRIENDRISAISERPMKGIDEDTLPVRLPHRKLDTPTASTLSQRFVDLRECCGAIDVRLSTTEEV